MGSEPDPTGIDLLGSLANIVGSGWTYYEIKQAAKGIGGTISVVGPIIAGSGLLSTFGTASVKSMNGGAGEAYGEAIGTTVGGWGGGALGGAGATLASSLFLAGAATPIGWTVAGVIIVGAVGTYAGASIGAAAGRGTDILLMGYGLSQGEPIYNSMGDFTGFYDLAPTRCFAAHARIQTSRTTSTAISSLRVGDVVRGL